MSMLLSSAVWAAPAAPMYSKPMELNVAGLTMKTTRDGWAVGSLPVTPSKTFLVHTSDMGRRWTNVTPNHVTLSVVGTPGSSQAGQPTFPFTTVDYLSGSVAWTVTESALSTHGMGTIVFSKTHDGGNHWHQWTVRLPNLADMALSDPILKEVDFLNTRDGWLQFGPAASADAGMVYPGLELWRTTNGGRSWIRVAQIPGRSWIVTGSATFTSPDEGWMTEGAQHRMPVLMNTTNSGRTWTKVALGAVPGTASSPTFTGRVGIMRIRNAALTNNQIRVTTDGGRHWDRSFTIPGQFVPIPPLVQQIRGHLIWDLDDNRLWRSTNSGAAWNLQDMASWLSQVRQIDFINRHVGWAQEKNRIWMTTLGGKQWTSWIPVLIR